MPAATSEPVEIVDDSTDSVEAKQADSSTTLVAEYRQLFAGPLPHPDIAERYERLQSGSFDRILTMVENEQEARLRLEAERHQAAVEFHKNDLEARSRRERLGVWLGFILAAGVLVIATLVIVSGGSLEAGVALIVGDAILIAGVFLHQSRLSQDVGNESDGRD